MVDEFLMLRVVTSQPTSPLHLLTWEPDDLASLAAPMGPELGAPVCASVSPICKMQIVRLWLTGAAGDVGILGRRGAAIFPSHPTRLSALSQQCFYQGCDLFISHPS